MLELQIKTNDLVTDPATDAYLRERADRLDALFDRITTCRVIVEGYAGHHRKGGPYEVRIDLDVPGALIAVTRQRGEDLRVAARKAFDAAERQLEDYLRRQRPNASSRVTPPRGHILRLFPDEGYGFLQDEQGNEIYFHRNSVVGTPFDRLHVGDEVRYAESTGDEGPRASTVTRAG